MSLFNLFSAATAVAGVKECDTAFDNCKQSTSFWSYWPLMVIGLVLVAVLVFAFYTWKKKLTR